jgi:acylphosphatase
VRNRADGAVELSAAGPGELVAALIAACAEGPPAARVAAVEIVEIADGEDDGGLGFTARPTL